MQWPCHVQKIVLHHTDLCSLIGLDLICCYFLFLIYSPFLFYYLSMNYVHFFLNLSLNIFFSFIQYNFCHLLCSDAWWYSYCFPLIFLLFLYVVCFGIVVITVTWFFWVVLEFKYTREGCSIESHFKGHKEWM